MERAPGLCFVGFGEVTYHWLRTLTGAGYPRDALGVLYLEHRGGRESVAAARAVELGVRLARSVADVPRDRQMYLHATSPAGAYGVFEACRPLLRAGTAWIDLNSTGPTVKVRMAADAAAYGTDFVDGAIMAPAWQLGHRTPVWMSGTGTARFEAWGKAWGTPTVVVGDEAGAAARVKMCRSVIVKGIAASLVEGLLLAEMNGIADPVLESLRNDFGPEIIDTLCNRLVQGTLRHGQRRADEMAGTLDLAAESHWQPRTMHSTAALLAYAGALGSRAVVPHADDYRTLLAGLAAEVRKAG